MENDDLVVSDDSINTSEVLDSEEIESEESEEIESEESEEIESEESEEVVSQKEVKYHENESESSLAYTLADPIDYSDKFEAIEKSLNFNTASIIALVLLFGLLKGLKKI